MKNDKLSPIMKSVLEALKDYFDRGAQFRLVTNPRSVTCWTTTAKATKTNYLVYPYKTMSALERRGYLKITPCPKAIDGDWYQVRRQDFYYGSPLHRLAAAAE